MSHRCDMLLGATYFWLEMDLLIGECFKLRFILSMLNYPLDILRLSVYLSIDVYEISQTNYVRYILFHA